MVGGTIRREMIHRETSRAPVVLPNALFTVKDVEPPALNGAFQGKAREQFQPRGSQLPSVNQGRYRGEGWLAKSGFGP